MVRFIVKSVCSGDANGHRSHPDAPHGRSQSARRTGGGGASYALHGLALQEGEDIFTCPVLATGIYFIHIATTYTKISNKINLTIS